MVLNGFASRVVQDVYAIAGLSQHMLEYTYLEGTIDAVSSSTLGTTRRGLSSNGGLVSGGLVILGITYFT